MSERAKKEAGTFDTIQTYARRLPREQVPWTSRTPRDTSYSEMKIREIDPQSKFEIELVAQWMRQTLVEVLGEVRGQSMYTMDWLIDRVRWHLDPKNTDGHVFLTENQEGKIIGQAIARIDPGATIGYFSTIFIEPSSRRQGIASSLMKHVEDWFLNNRMPKVIYNTADNHFALIGLFKSHGYNVTHSESGMVQLTKILQHL